MINYETYKRLTSNKKRKLTVMLNPNLVEMFKEACKKNDIKPTYIIENHMIKFIDERGFLDQE